MFSRFNVPHRIIPWSMDSVGLNVIDKIFNNEVVSSIYTRATYFLTSYLRTRCKTSSVVLANDDWLPFSIPHCVVRICNNNASKSNISEILKLHGIRDLKRIYRIEKMEIPSWNCLLSFNVDVWDVHKYWRNLSIRSKVYCCSFFFFPEISLR